MAKVDKWLKEKNLKKITEWAEDKHNTVADIARNMGISPSTLHRWLKEYEEIHRAFEDGRKTVDGEVENSFFKMCIGYHEKVIKTQKVKRYKLDDKGKRIEEYEEFVPVEEEVYIPPSVAAQKFYLCNRMPDKYMPETKALPESEENGSGVVLMPEVIELEQNEDGEKYAVRV